MDDKYKTPLFIAVLAFTMTLATCMLVPMSCNHKVVADVVEVRTLPEYGMCRLKLRYDEIETTKIRECSSSGSTFPGCYRHWDHGDFFAYGSYDKRVLYIPIPGVVAMIVSSVLLWLAACIALVYADWLKRRLSHII